MSLKKQWVVKTGMTALLFTPLFAHAYLDERTPIFTPEPPSVSATEMTGSAPNSFEQSKKTGPLVGATLPQGIPLPPIAITTPSAVGVGAGGDFSNPKWAEAYRSIDGDMPLADALISLYFPVFNSAVEINAEPFMLNKKVFVTKGLSRKELAHSIGVQLNAHIRHQGNEVTVVTFGDPTVDYITAAPAPRHSPPITTVAPSVNLGVEVDIVEVETMPILDTKTWLVKEGDMLSTSMLKWSKEWGWRLIWQASVDYRIAADIRIVDSYLGGVEKILSAYGNAPQPLWGDWNESQKVLVVSEPSYNPN